MDQRMEFKEEYFQWLCHFVKCYSRRRLLRYLHSVDFQYKIPMDGNRYEDGINLRYRFAEDRGYPHKYAAAWIDDSPCSVLEMMVALAVRLEEDICRDPEYGDRTPKWFEQMLKSMDIWYMTDDEYSEALASSAINRMLERRYSRNGEGGLFTVHHAGKDMRRAEIWYQAMWYLNEVL